MKSVRRAKIDGIAGGRAPRVLDICSGCGGMSLGFKVAGFDLSGHLESDPVALKTFAMNLAPREHLEAWAQPRDLITCSPATLVADFGFDLGPHEAFDVVVAGLPCQAFARIGRSKLRSIAGKADAFRRDSRATLYLRLLDYVRATQPVAIVLENVPDILNFGGHNVPEEISATLDGMGYETRYTLLNAAFYGVPQLRERLFLIAVDARLGLPPAFPLPTHNTELPVGYEGSRRVALKHVARIGSHFLPIPEPDVRLPRAVSARAALADLPFISEHAAAPITFKKRRVSDRLGYRSMDGLSEYALKMRAWPGLGTESEVDGHVVRLTPRDYPIFQKMPHGADYPSALAVAENLFRSRLRRLGGRGHAPRPDSAAYDQLRKEVVPPYDSGKFPNKWWKLHPDHPVRTLTAHLGKDTYSHIHYDGRQKRTISVREAARLQSFPDGFRFAGQMNAAFRQIGNAVPPLLAFAVAQLLLKSLRRDVAGGSEESQVA